MIIMKLIAVLLWTQYFCLNSGEAFRFYNIEARRFRQTLPIYSIYNKMNKPI